MSFIEVTNAMGWNGPYEHCDCCDDDCKMTHHAPCVRSDHEEVLMEPEKIEVPVDARVEAVATAIYEQERAASPVSKHWKSWPELPGADRGVYRDRSAEVLRVADNF